MLTSGSDYSQGLAAGVLAGNRNGAVLLSDRDSLGHSTKTALNGRGGSISRLTLMGGLPWLGAGVESDLDYGPPACGSIVGSVTAADTGLPIEAVSVTAYGFDPANTDYPVYRAHAATTGPDGSFEIGHLETGQYWLRYVDPSGEHATQSYPHAPGTGGHGDRVSVEQTPAAPTTVRESLDTSTAWMAQRVKRLSGADRYATAVDISRRSYVSADTVVLVSGSVFPDALSASALAGAYRAPLLLTRPDSLPANVLREIRRLGASRVIIVGGGASVSYSVQTALLAGGLDVARLDGADRYAVSARVYRHLRGASGLPTVAPAPFVVRGDTFPDAIVASPFAFRQVRPILLVRPTYAPTVIRNVFRDYGIGSAVVVGGTSSVSDGVLGQLGRASGSGSLQTVRLAGPDRYATATRVAQHWERPFDFVGIASGTAFADALTGGVLAGARGGPLLLTAGGSLSTPTARTLARHADTLTQVRTYGGTATITGSTQAAIQRAVTVY